MARQNQAAPGFDPEAVSAADAKWPGTHALPVVHRERRIDGAFSADHGDAGAVAQLAIRRRNRPIPALKAGLGAIAERLSKPVLLARVACRGLILCSGVFSGAVIPHLGWRAPGLSQRREILPYAAGVDSAGHAGR